MDSLRRQTEQCDSLGGLLGFSSLAGGTGSGLGIYSNFSFFLFFHELIVCVCVCMCFIYEGAYLWGEIRDEYPGVPMISHVVWPHEGGDVIVQHYNALLSLAKLHQVVFLSVSH